MLWQKKKIKQREIFSCRLLYFGNEYDAEFWTQHELTIEVLITEHKANTSHR